MLYARKPHFEKEDERKKFHKRDSWEIFTYAMDTRGL